MKAILVAKGRGRLAVLTVALAMALSVTGCATGPLGSHGVAYIPQFEDTCPTC
jgi:hypothetical protein